MRAVRGMVTVLVGLLAVTLWGVVGAGALNKPQATHQVTTVFTTLFNANDKNLKAREALLQDAPKYKAKFTALFNSTEAKANPTLAKVDKVTFPSATACKAAAKVATCAQVAYGLELATTGAKLLTGRTGYAVLVKGHWYVADASFCTLAKLAGSSC